MAATEVRPDGEDVPVTPSTAAYTTSPFSIMSTASATVDDDDFLLSSARIVTTELETTLTPKPFTLYVVEVQWKSTSWTIKKRYSQFFALHSWIAEHIQGPEVALPLFPEKTYTRGKLVAQVVEERKNLLQNYLTYVCQNPLLATLWEIKFFFEVNQHCKPLTHTVLCCLPDRDFDPTESSVPWKILINSGVRVVFATESGQTAQADETLTRQAGVGVFGMLDAEPEAKSFYREMAMDASFLSPVAWASINVEEYHGLLLPGGHAPGMRQYLESEVLQGKVAEYWQKSSQPVAAICHGALLCARTRGQDGQSILQGLTTTTLPKASEVTAFALTRFKMGRRYRTYPVYCADEVKSLLARPDDYRVGPAILGSKDSIYNERPAFVVQDGRYISARWPGDAYTFGRRFALQVSHVGEAD